MRKLAALMCMALILLSCKKAEVEDFFYPESPDYHITEQSGFSVTLTGEELDPDLFFRTVAADDCFRHTARKILQLQPLVRGSYADRSDPDSGFFRFQGEIDPVIAPLTGDLVQEFQCSVTVYPFFSSAGEIVGLEEERTIVARGDRVTLLLFETIPEELPAYFFVGRRVTEQGRNLISIFGSGKIIQVVDDPGLEPNAGYDNSTLAQGLMMETRHEVNREDLIFLANMDLAARKRTTVQEEPVLPTPMTDEVMVKPRTREPVPVPTEMK